MSSVVAFIVIAFAISGVGAFLSSKHRAWGWVDVIYYPLGAVGVALFVANTTHERRLSELSRLLDEQNAQLERIAATEPSVDVPSVAFLPPSVQLIASIPQLASACRGGSRSDPLCYAAERLDSTVAQFVSITYEEHADTASYLAAVCNAADTLLVDLKRSGGLSPGIADLLIARVATAASANYRYLAYEAFAKEQVGAFRRDAAAHVELLRTAALNDGSPASNFLLEVRKVETDFAATIFSGLYPCVVAPRTDLSRLVEWTSARDAQQLSVDSTRAERERLRDADSSNPVLSWIELSMWPFIVTAALALKFGKSIATLRRAEVPAAKKDGVRDGSVPRSVPSTTLSGLSDDPAGSDAVQGNSESSLPRDESDRTGDERAV